MNQERLEKARKSVGERSNVAICMIATFGIEFIIEGLEPENATGRNLFVDLPDSCWN
ncbi:MAG: hypothetical protein JRN20_00140 [Nitrososphaerota archaeon]|nr:hypothetical protein [Nitrososphaerota archaeon]MDG6923934.1 hypothetical protein [Nitrososphaerota archaeon]